MACIISLSVFSQTKNSGLLTPVREKQLSHFEQRISEKRKMLDEKKQQILQQKQKMEQELRKHVSYYTDQQSIKQQKAQKMVLDSIVDETSGITRVFAYNNGQITSETKYSMGAAFALTNYAFNARGQLIKEVSFYWDGSQWEPTDSIIATYEPVNGYCTAYEKWAYGAGQWSGQWKYIAQYDNAGREILLEWYNWIGNNWVGESKYVAQYDNAGREILLEWYNWIGNSWVGDNKTVMTYDNQGRELSYIYYEWDGSDWEPIEKEEDDYPFDYANFAYMWQDYCNVHSYEWDGNDWKLIYEFKFTLDAQGYPTSFEDIDCGYYERKIMGIIHYDANRNITSVVISEYNFDDDLYYLTDSTAYFDFDSHHNPAYYIYYEWNGNGYTPLRKYEQTWDTYGNTTLFINYGWTGSTWIENYKHEYAFDARGYQLLHAGYYWSGSDWIEESKRVTDYDVNGNEILFEYYENGVGQNKYIFQYDANSNPLHHSYYSWVNNAWLKYSEQNYEYDIAGAQIYNDYLTDYDPDSVWDYGNKSIWIEDETILRTRLVVPHWYNYAYQVTNEIYYDYNTSTQDWDTSVTYTWYYSMQTIQAPATVTTLTATEIGTTTATLNGIVDFGDATVTHVGFMYAGENQSYTIVTNAATSSPTFSVVLSNLQTNTQYRFRAIAITSSADTVFGEMMYFHTEFLSIENPQLEADLSIYPNPVSNELIINLKENTLQAVEMFDINGRLVEKYTFGNASSTVLDLSSFASGAYFVRIYTSKGVLNKEIMKR
jgi:hypothetical protein